jgi:hypothetical protein
MLVTSIDSMNSDEFTTAELVAAVADFKRRYPED